MAAQHHAVWAQHLGTWELKHSFGPKVLLHAHSQAGDSCALIRNYPEHRAAVFCGKKVIKSGSQFCVMLSAAVRAALAAVTGIAAVEVSLPRGEHLQHSSLPPERLQELLVGMPVAGVCVP